MPFPLTIITPEGRAFEDSADSLNAPGVSGHFEVLTKHANMVAALESGILSVGDAINPKFFVIGGGLAHVRPDSVTILVDSIVEASSREDAASILAQSKTHPA